MVFLWNALFTVILFINLLTKSTASRSIPNISSSAIHSSLYELATELELNATFLFNDVNAGNFEFPSMAAIKNEDGSFVCSANIMTNLHLLTTCRCLTVETGSTMAPLSTKNPGEMVVIAGIIALDMPYESILSIGQVRNVIDIKIHPLCTQAYDYDYGVVEVDHFLYFTRFVQPFPWQLTDEPNFSKFLKLDCVLPGWQMPFRYFNPRRRRYESLMTKNYIVLAFSFCWPTENRVFDQSLESPARICGLYGGIEELQDYGSGLYCNGGLSGLLTQHYTNNISEFISINSAAGFLLQFYEEFGGSTLNSSSTARGINIAVIILALVALRCP